MESKTKHRILGVVVIAGLIVIAWPFMQGSRENSQEVIAIKEPAFPDQSKEVQPVAEMENAQTEPASAASPVQPHPDAQPTTPIASSAATDKEATLGKEEMKNQPDDTITTDHPVEPSKSAPPIPEPSDEQKATSTKAPSDDAKPAKKSASLKKAPHSSLIKNAKRQLKQIRKVVAVKKVKDNHLFNIQDPSWVIQVGSYKNKTHALKVVNQLRANGYPAFIQQFASGDNNTRVFIGPENKQAQARQLARDVNEKMHLQGIVISYQPLAV